MSQQDDIKDHLMKEAKAFDRHISERIKHGFVPDLQNLKPVDWFYNNVWREPEIFEIQWGERIRQLIENAHQQGGRVLEVGCGSGFIALELVRAGLEVTAVDLSPESIKIAESYAKSILGDNELSRLDYQCMDVMECGFAAASFDTIVCFRSLHHMADLAAIVSRIQEWLKPRGLFLISEPIRAGFDVQSAELAALLRVLLPTWQDKTTVIEGVWDDSRWEQQVGVVLHEYKMECDHKQSPLDNTTDDFSMYANVLAEGFDLEKTEFADAFVDKLLGGLRGDNRFQLARFLKFYDDYLVRHQLMPPTSVEIVARKS